MSRKQRKGGSISRICLEVLELENRVLPSTTTFNPGVILLQPSGGASPAATGGPSGLSPSQVRTAYGFNQITFDNGTIVGNGAGQTIAIVDAYDDPNIASDLAAFDAEFGLAAPPSFTKVNENGGSSLPTANSGWGLEESLDVEWAHAIAPDANILLVEASSNSLNDLLTAVSYAAKAPGVSVVSMSWGSSEFSGEGTDDSYFTTPTGHQGVTFVASAGDNGAPSEWPSISTHVLDVGGTTLSVDSAGDYLGETAWSDSGGGLSAYLSQPSYQQGIVTQSSSKRAGPDVAYDADPNTGVAVYDSYGYSGWVQVGGTSAGSPQWAALVAIADQGRALAGEGSLDGYSQTLPMIYSLPQSDFHDITSGSNGNPAGPGYDLVTGRGSPIANLVVAGLVGTTSTNPPPTPSAPTNLTATAGNAQITLNWTGVTGETYNLYRSTSTGTETLLTSGLSSTSYTDTGLTNGTTYFYKVTAVVGGVESGKSNEASATPEAPVNQPPTALLSIDSGGGAVGSYIKDAGYSGGSTNSTTHSISTTGVTNPAPQGVYQTSRTGNFTYTITGATAGATYTVRLDFSDNQDIRAGQRVFNVSINGKTVLSRFDIIATTGGEYRAIAEFFTITAPSNGRITITFSSVVGSAEVDGLSIYAGTVTATRSAMIGSPAASVIESSPNMFLAALSGTGSSTPTKTTDQGGRLPDRGPTLTDRWTPATSGNGTTADHADNDAEAGDDVSAESDQLS